MIRIPGLQKNPVTMVGTLQRCWLFTFRTPVARAVALLPSSLEPVTHGEWAFWNVVVSRIEHMRPRYTPAPIGVSYWHVAYRLYVRFTPSGTATPIEGLCFLRSDCDSALMARAGNIVTDFNFHVAGVSVEENAEHVRIAVDGPRAMGSALLSKSVPPALPAGSAFATLDEAAAFLKYKPFGISVDTHACTANIVRIVRDEPAWHSSLLHIESQDWQFLRDHDVHPEICYQVDPIAYQWNRGRVYRV